MRMILMAAAMATALISHQSTARETVSGGAAIVEILLDRLSQGDREPAQTGGLPRMAFDPGER